VGSEVGDKVGLMVGDKVGDKVGLIVLSERVLNERIRKNCAREK